MQLRLVIIAFGIVALGGCWHEVEYTPPPTAAGGEKPAQVTADDAARSPAPAPVPSDESKTEQAAKTAAGEFGDDLAATLQTEQRPSTATIDETPTTPIPDSEPAATRDVGDRYATKPSDIAPRTQEGESRPASTASSATDSLFNEPVDPNAPPASPVNDSMLPEQREAIAEMSDAPIPNLNDDDIPTLPAVEEWNTRRAAWLLGSKLSLAALANEHGAPADQVAKLFNQSAALAKKLDISLKPLPERPKSGTLSPANNAALNYLFSEGQEIGSHLANGRGADHAALFEVAVKSNILLVLYKPGSATSQALASAIERAGQRANLPAKLWQPLMDALAAKATLVDVRKAVYALHDATDKYLDEPPR